MIAHTAVFPKPEDRPFAYLEPDTTNVVLRLSSTGGNTVHLVSEILTDAEKSTYLEQLILTLTAAKDALHLTPFGVSS
jgi:hypothetical protein